MPSPYDADLALALALADTADAVTAARFRAADLRVETKPDLTPVSDADRAVERELREVIERERPGDGVVGEEYGDTGSGSRRWIVDPIDGTKNYVRGLPVWASLIALEVDGEVGVGVVSAPALGRRWWAARGSGAWAGPCAGGAGEAEQCRVSAVRDLGDAFVSYSSLDWPGDGFGRLVDAVWRTRAFGDFWSHVLVAEGCVDASLEPVVALWDVAPLQVIVEEAGGRFSDLTGAATPGGGSVVCSNGLLHDDVLATLAG
jgi:histidinol-phosphatase